MENISIVGEAIAGQQAKSLALRKRIKILAGDVQRYTFDLAEALLEAQETRCYLGWGFDSLPEYAEVELGLKARKSQYLSRIAKVMRDCGIKRADYEGAGLTNLRSISTLDPKGTYYNSEEKQHESLVDHIVDLVASAPELSTQEVEERVAHLKGMDGENTMVTRSYSVTKSCYENTIQRCFELVRRRLGSAGRDGTGQAREYSDGAVLECLAAEFLADPRNFLEETDESHEQVEIPMEESNAGNTLDPVDISEDVQKQFSIPREP